jgi:hypothetical protein
MVALTTLTVLSVVLTAAGVGIAAWQLRVMLRQSKHRRGGRGRWAR